jgi:hypothetical protein
VSPLVAKDGEQRRLLRGRGDSCPVSPDRCTCSRHRALARVRCMIGCTGRGLAGSAQISPGWLPGGAEGGGEPRSRKDLGADVVGKWPASHLPAGLCAG